VKPLLHAPTWLHNVAL